MFSNSVQPGEDGGLEKKPMPAQQLAIHFLCLCHNFILTIASTCLSPYNDHSCALLHLRKGKGSWGVESREEGRQRMEEGGNVVAACIASWPAALSL